MGEAGTPVRSAVAGAGDPLAALSDLCAGSPDAVPAYLGAHSGLPGPRANLPLADAFAATAPVALIWSLAESPDEFLAFCGTEGLGRLVLDPAERTSALAALRRAAGDERWRVREGAARALQLVGDVDPALLHRVVDEWSAVPDAWLARAGVAAICEPRLLHTEGAQTLALRVCDAATALLLSGGEIVQDPARAKEAHRVLRQALGYGWSVAIAASPEAGLAAFRVLAASDDPDARWIVRSNLTKARLRSVLAEHNLWGVLG
ncbi:HEAT repeat domain-containing protein [Cryobacterium sp. SO2]|uniref:HEAT repeat domain-containing protein n=1 Tax=Cryobacterium sp. SO2 TaxID=1897060 RepID=UPI00223D6EE9|nr:HEAT repeat domain-containing protein [Cryobacterium sp. SO2]WEO77459.1 HEAT repeat domain-containing protein [Cryobacterium sp. SO2]